MKYGFDEDALSLLLPPLDGLSPKRRRHILEVASMAARIGRIYCSDSEDVTLLRAAALLHDLTKEYTTERHIEILESRGIAVSDIEKAAPKTLHAMSAAALIPESFPLFACSELIGAVRWHTTGRENMTLFEKIIYLADYIDESREYPECVRLRESFWSAHPENMSEDEKYRHMTDVLLDSFEVTYRDLLSEGRPIHPATNDARNYLLLERAGMSAPEAK